MKCKGSKHEWVREKIKLKWNEKRFVFFAMNKKISRRVERKLRWDVKGKKRRILGLVTFIYRNDSIEFN